MMANRQQRRMMEKNPQVRALSKKFAEDFTSTVMSVFEPMLEAEKQGKKVSFEIDDVARKLFESKGEELGNAMNQILGSIQAGATKPLVKSLNKPTSPKIIIRGK